MKPSKLQTGIHCEIKYKKPQTQYNLYQECVFLYLISGCSILSQQPLLHARRPESRHPRLTELRGTHPAVLRLPYAMSGTDTAYAAPAVQSGAPPPRSRDPSAYAMPGTDIAYDVMRALWDVWYWHDIRWYLPTRPVLVPDTGIVYAAAGIANSAFCLRACY
eukprot:1171522-Rhodomonas_salina.6